MVIYEVVATVKAERASEWHEWIIPHMQEVVDTGCFVSAELEKIIDPPSTEVMFRVRYHAPSMQHIERYLSEYAPPLRAAGIMRFGDDATTRRTIAEQL